MVWGGFAMVFTVRDGVILLCGAFIQGVHYDQ